MPSERAQTMASLFDFNLEASFEETSDYNVKAKDDPMAESFDEKVKTIQSIMEPEPEPEPKPETLKTEKADKPEKVKETENEPEPVKVAAPKQSSDKLLVDAIKESAELVTEMEIPDPQPLKAEKPKEQVIVEPEPEPESENEELNDGEQSEPDPQTIETEEPKATVVQNENPLGLIGNELRFFKYMQEKHPAFILYNGNPAYRDFYYFKLQCLRSMLGQFPVLDIAARRAELTETNCNHYVGNTISAESIRAKMDECYRSRIRVAQMLAEVYEQFYVWEKNVELLESKLWTDHESRGAHKRQALVLVHMQHEIEYVKSMEGFIEASRKISDLLGAAADSLSRQLTCVQQREPSSADHGYRLEQIHQQQQQQVRQDEQPKTVVKEQKQSPTNQDPKLDGLDGIAEGTVISPPERSREARVVDLGKFDPEDELMSLT